MILDVAERPKDAEVQDEKPAEREEKPELTDKEKLTQSVEKFSNISNDSFQRELTSLAETVKDKFKLEHDKSELESFIEANKSQVIKALGTKAGRLRIPKAISDSKLGKKLGLADRDITYGDLTTALVGALIAGASSAQVKVAFYSLTGVGGVVASAVAGAVIGGTRSAITEGYSFGKEARSVDNWRQQIDQMTDPASKLRAIELLIKDKDFKKHLKADAGETIDLITTYGEIAADAEEAGLLDSVMALKGLGRGMDGVDRYITRVDQETRKRMFKAFGQGAVRGMIFSTIGYGAAKGLEWVFDKVGGAFMSAAHAQGTSEVPGAQGHVWHTGEGKQFGSGHLNIDNQGHLSGESIVKVDDKLAGVGPHNGDVIGATNHEVAKQVGDALAKDHLLNATQQGSFQDKLTELLSKEHSGSFASGETVRIGAHTLNTALEQSGAHLDTIAIGHLPVVGAPVSPKIPETPKPSEPAQPIKPEVPANPPGNSTPLNPTPPNIQPGVVPGPPGSATPLSPGGQSPSWFNRTEHFLEQNEKNIGHGAAWVGLIASAGLAIVGAVRLRRYVKERAKKQQQFEELLKEYKETDPAQIIKDLEFLSSYDEWEGDDEERAKGDEAFKAVLEQLVVNLPYIAPTEKFQNWLKNDTSHKDISWKINPETVYSKGKKWIGVVGNLGAKGAIRPSAFWENFSNSESTPMPKEPQYVDTEEPDVLDFYTADEVISNLSSAVGGKKNDRVYKMMNSLSDRIAAGEKFFFTHNGERLQLIQVKKIGAQNTPGDPINKYQMTAEHSNRSSSPLSYNQLVHEGSDHYWDILSGEEQPAPEPAAGNTLEEIFGPERTQPAPAEISTAAEPMTEPAPEAVPESEPTPEPIPEPETQAAPVEERLLEVHSGDLIDEVHSLNGHTGEIGSREDISKANYLDEILKKNGELHDAEWNELMGLKTKLNQQYRQWIDNKKSELAGTAAQGAVNSLDAEIARRRAAEDAAKEAAAAEADESEAATGASALEEANSDEITATKTSEQAPAGELHQFTQDLDDIESNRADVNEMRKALESSGLANLNIVLPPESHQSMMTFFQANNLDLDVNLPFRLKIGEGNKLVLYQEGKTGRPLAPERKFFDRLFREATLTPVTEQPPAAAAGEPSLENALKQILGEKMGAFIGSVQEAAAQYDDFAIVSSPTEMVHVRVNPAHDRFGAQFVVINPRSRLLADEDGGGLPIIKLAERYSGAIYVNPDSKVPTAPPAAEPAPTPTTKSETAVLGETELPESETLTMSPAKALEALARLNTTNSSQNRGTEIIRALKKNRVSFNLNQDGLDSILNPRQEFSSDWRLGRPVKIEAMDTDSASRPLFRIAQNNGNQNITAFVDGRALLAGLTSTSDQTFELPRQARREEEDDENLPRRPRREQNDTEDEG